MKTTYKEIREIEELNLLIEQGNATLKELGYTEHSKKHAAKVSDTAGKILTELGYGKHKIELARIAGYMHDIGNSINRHDHAHSGALLAYQILKDTEMSLKDVLVIMTAIGHHDEATGDAVDPVSAALILADKTDVRRNRVQNPVPATFDKLVFVASKSFNKFLAACSLFFSNKRYAMNLSKSSSAPFIKKIL